MWTGQDPGFIDPYEPINRTHPLNLGVVVWWLGIPTYLNSMWCNFQCAEPLVFTNVTAANIENAGTLKGQFKAIRIPNANLTDTKALRTASNIIHNVGTGDFTWAVNVKVNTFFSGPNAILGNEDYTPGLYSRTGSSNWGVYFDGFGFVESGVTLTAGAGYHLTVRRLGGLVTTYHEGFRTGDTVVTVSIPNSRITLGSAATTPSSAGDVTISSFTFWNRALSSQNIALHFQECRSYLPSLLNRYHPYRKTWYMRAGAAAPAGTQPPRSAHQYRQRRVA